MKSRMERLLRKAEEQGNKVALEIYHSLIDQMSVSLDKSAAGWQKQAQMLFNSLDEEYKKTGSPKTNRQKELIRELTFLELTEKDLDKVVDKRKLRGTFEQNVFYLKSFLAREKYVVPLGIVMNFVKKVMEKRK